MPISPQCPRRCAQSDARGLRHTSPLRGSIKRIVRAPLGGAPSQGSELLSLTPEASLERLVPLVDYLAAWKLLPNVSQWVLQTVEKGYRIQFAFPPPRFSGVTPTLAGSGYGTRGESPIKEEGGHRGGPSSREGIRVLQPVFHSSQEGWQVASDHRSASTEPLSQSAEVQDAHAEASCVTNQVRGLVCHDRSKRRILPRIHPSVSQEVPNVRFWGQSIPISGSSLRSSTLTPHVYKSSGCNTSFIEAAGHPHTKLYRRLADSSSVGDGGGETSRCRPRSYKTVGVETKRQEKCAFSSSEDHLFRRGVEFDHDAGTNVSCSDRVDFHVSQESERRPVTHCQAVSEIAGSDGSCVQRDTIWPAVHETPAVVAQDQGIFSGLSPPAEKSKSSTTHPHHILQGHH